jgi:CPA1 family monovalent cation:H+ antiporter
MKPIIRKLNLAADDSLDREVHTARKLVYQALLDVIKDESSDHAQVLRTEYQAVIDHAESSDQTTSFLELPGRALRRRALKSARERAIELRNREVIGVQAYRLLIQEIDLAELSAAGSLSG